MAAEPNSMSLNAALEAAVGGPDQILNFIQVLSRSRVYVLTDRNWDGRTPPDSGMRLMLVSDGTNQQQTMLAVFTDAEHAATCVQSFGDMAHAFRNVVQVDMAWALLGLPANAGIMVNPNTPRAFRVSPEVGTRLRRGAQLSASLRGVERNQQKPVQLDAAAATKLAEVEQRLFEIEGRTLAGDVTSAESLLKKLPEGREYLKFTLCAKAMIARAKEDFDAATKLLHDAILENDDPRLAGKFWSTLGRYYKDLDKLKLAEDAYIMACSSDPMHLEYALGLSRLLADQFRIEEALTLLRRAEALHPEDPIPLMQRGTLLMELGQEETALKAYDQAAMLEKDSAAVQLNRAICLQALGRLDESRLAFEHALRLDPTLDGYSQYVQTRKFDKQDPEANAPFLELLESRARESMPLSTRIDGEFALAKAYDTLGNLDESFEHLKRANKLKRSILTYSSDDSRKDMDVIKQIFTKEFIEKYKGTCETDLAPIFVVGMPRSGTTLTEQILAAHSKVNPGNELTYLATMAAEFNDVWGKRFAAGKAVQADLMNDLRRMGETYKERTARLQLPGKRFTDKMPGNFLHIGFIYLLFPNATVIHCHRHPADTCLSCYERLFSKGLVFSYDLHELGVYYKLYLDVMRHWREVLPEDFILDMKYELTVSDPENRIRRLLDFCKLDFEEDCLEFHKVKRTVTTASSLQVRKPMYKSSLNRWMKYGDKLQPLLDALGPELVGPTD